MRGTIRQRPSGSWEIQVFLGRDAAGKRMRKTETVRGKRADGERRLRQILSDLDRGVAPPKTRYKVGEWLDKWLNEVVVPNRRQKTVDRYEICIRRHIKPRLGNVGLDKLVPLQIQELYAELLEGGMAPRGVQAVHNVLSGAIKHALRMEVIGRDVVALVKPPAAKKTEAYTPSVEQVHALLAQAEAEAHWLWPLLHLIVYTGMRRGEALALMWSNVDLAESRLLVTQSWVVSTVGVLLEPPKSASGNRVVDLDSDTVSILRRHRDNQIGVAVELGVEPPEEVFPSNDLGGLSNPNVVQHAVRRLAVRAGCPDVTTRSLRHFHATLILQAKQNPVVVSKRLGHSSTTITMETYAHALEGWAAGGRRGVCRRHAVVAKCWTKCWTKRGALYLTSRH